MINKYFLAVTVFVFVSLQGMDRPQESNAVLLATTKQEQLELRDFIHVGLSQVQTAVLRAYERALNEQVEAITDWLKEPLPGCVPSSAEREEAAVVIGIVRYNLQKLQQELQRRDQ